MGTFPKFTVRYQEVFEKVCHFNPFSSSHIQCCTNTAIRQAVSKSLVAYYQKCKLNLSVRCGCMWYLVEEGSGLCGTSLLLPHPRLCYCLVLVLTWRENDSSYTSEFCPLEVTCSVDRLQVANMLRHEIMMSLVWCALIRMVT